MSAKIAVFDFENITKDYEIKEIKVYVKYKKPDGKDYEICSDKFTAVMQFDMKEENNE